MQAMSRRRMIIALVVLVCAAAVFLAAWVVHRAPRADEASTPSVTLRLASDTYPLYTGVAWGAVFATTTDVLSGYEADAASARDITNIAAVTTPFERYYAAKLPPLGWVIQQNLTASGPGSNITVYKKGSEYLVVGFRTVFKDLAPDRPEQCPCDTTLYLMSGTR